MNNTIGLSLIVVGLVFDFFGCLGLVRMPDVYNRLQAATKCVTLGTCTIMLGVFVISGFNAVGIKALLCGLFLLLTSPTAAHALSRGAYRAGVKLWDKSVVDKYGNDKPKG
ncbi:MAG: monovalent cation/H(+) antiporter subunit G [Candidatus Omnitrophota bacterium]